MARSSWAIIIGAFIAALLGVAVGRALLGRDTPQDDHFHAFVHEKLGLDAGQRAQIEAMEKRFLQEQAAYEREMRDDNRRLAEAIKAEKGYGPQVADAVDRSHQAMGMLQKRTLQHLFAMRKVLRPDQARRFDQEMVNALTTPDQ